MLNKVIIMGRLTRDPELKQTQSGIAVCRLSVAVNRQYANKETGEREADFIECEAWRNTAEFIARYFNKGSMILVEGQMRNNNYTDGNGVKHYGMKVLVDSVSFCGEKRGDSDASAQKSYNTQQNSPPLFGTVQAPQNNPYAKAQNETSEIGDISEFEAVLSEGEVPF